MEKKFILPASTMLGGIAVWLILFFAVNWELAELWQELLLGILVGGLIVFSA